MRILICEDSEHNLQSAREFAEKVKGEHEVDIEATHPLRGLHGIKEGKYDLVLTDLFMKRTPDREIEPIGLFVALGALQHGLPVAIVTDGVSHSDEPAISFLENYCLEYNNERLRVYFVDADMHRPPESKYYSPHKGSAPGRKPIKDWEFCFHALMKAQPA
jgi:CheY-like chemotaxis protein